MRQRTTGNWSAIVVNYNDAVHLDACLIALAEMDLRPQAVIVIDNASTDDSLLELHGYPWANVVALRENRGYAGGANIGLDLVETDYFVILNPDVELDAHYGAELVRTFDANSRLGAAGSLLVYPDGKTVQHAGGRLLWPQLYGSHIGRGEALADDEYRERDIDFATGAALGLRMRAVRDIGGFDEQFLPAYYEDVDLSTRLRSAGWRVRFIPDLRGVHHEGVTLRHSSDYYRFLHRNRLRYALKHLSAAQWKQEFLPAEMARLRHEFASLPEGDWISKTGVEAIDQVWSTLGGSGDWQLESSLPELVFPALDDVETLHAFRSVQGDVGKSRVPFVSWLRRIVTSLGPRQYVDQALADQRAFNDAVVRLLEAQQRYNREQAAAMLLFALLALEQGRRLSDSDEAIDDRDRDGMPKIGFAGPDGTGDEGDDEGNR